ncbi:MAG TPA: hypothetical protein VGP06_11315 [Janthinobacterium sp.]|nr:hypothetical protein [Janthinobacterium sp.]
MAVSHKNKTLTSFFAFLLGGLGAQRFYLRGARDIWAWAHLASIPAAGLVALLFPGADWFYKILPLVLSALAGFLEALVLGLTPDEKWDAVHNRASARKSHSHWPLALLMVLSLAIGAGVLIATISRLFDLLYTGGAYG